MTFMRIIVFEAGDAVWLHNPQRKPGRSPKLTRAWEGPYTVIKAINDVVYRIQLTPQVNPKLYTAIAYGNTLVTVNQAGSRALTTKRLQLLCQILQLQTIIPQIVPSLMHKLNLKLDPIMKVTRMPEQMYTSLQYNLNQAATTSLLSQEL